MTHKHGYFHKRLFLDGPGVMKWLKFTHLIVIRKTKSIEFQKLPIELANINLLTQF